MTKFENKIALTNLGKYNEGILVYDWLSLPFTEYELQKTLNKIGINKKYEEFFISDYETDLDGFYISEYENLEALNELFKKIDDINSDDFILICKAYIDLTSSYLDIEECLKIYENCEFSIYYGCDDMEDVAREYVEVSGMLNEIPDHLQYYFDFEAFGRDMQLEGRYCFIDGNCIQLY